MERMRASDIAEPKPMPTDSVALLLSALREREDRLLDQREVCRRTTLHRNTIHKLEHKGEFPKRRVVAGGKIVWRESEVASWIASRPTAEEARGGPAHRAGDR
jgi:predicted DNA-binding transcriptional regulator AlpA